MNRVAQEAIRSFGLYYPELVDKVAEYRYESHNRLVVEMKDGQILIYDDITTRLVNPSLLDPKKDFGDRLRRIMYSRAMSQKDLSEKTGLTQCSISNYINGKREPSYRVAGKLADALNCSTEDFRFVDRKE